MPRACPVVFHARVLQGVDNERESSTGQARGIWAGGGPTLPSMPRACPVVLHALVLQGGRKRPFLPPPCVDNERESSTGQARGIQEKAQALPSLETTSVSPPRDKPVASGPAAGRRCLRCHGLVP